MKVTPVDKPLPVVEKPFWLRFEFQVRRFGFVLLLLIVGAALAGLFSKGYLSDSRLTNADGTLSLHYEKFNRLLSDADMKIIAVSSGGKRDRIILGSDFMESFRIDNLQPQPDKMYSRNGKLIIEYENPQAGVPQTMWLSLTPMKAGFIKSTVAVNDGPETTFRQLIYP